MTKQKKFTAPKLHIEEKDANALRNWVEFWISAANGQAAKAGQGEPFAAFLTTTAKGKPVYVIRDRRLAVDDDPYTGTLLCTDSGPEAIQFARGLALFTAPTAPSK